MDKAERKLRLLSAHTFLFVPGDQPDRILKALQAKTDAVIIDFEDSVKSESKSEARAQIVKLLTGNQSATRPLILIRTNAHASKDFIEDLKVAFELQVDAIVLPKFVPGSAAISAEEVISKIEGNTSDPMPIIGLVETTAGVLNLLNSSTIPERVIRLALGAADLYADLGVAYKAAGPNTDLAMASLVLASANAKLGAPIDSPHFAIADSEGLRKSSSHAYQIGFGGKLCIHPDQLEIVAESFATNSNETEWAERVVERWSARDQKSGAILIDGSLVDEAMVKRAKQILGLI